MPTASYFLRNTLLGQSSFSASIRPHSFVLVCPVCGEAWGRVLVTDTGNFKPYWEVRAVCCEKHSPQGVPEWGRVPGSFLAGFGVEASDLSPYDAALAVDNLPVSMLQREFFLHLSFNETVPEDQP